jgi:hypothetical protein
MNMPRKAKTIGLAAYTVVLMAMIASTLCYSHEKDGAGPAAVELSAFAEAFENCKFAFIDTQSIKHLPPPPQGWGMQDSNGCTINLKANGFITLGLSDITLIIAQKTDDQLDQLTSSTGFQRAPDGTWKFNGNALGAVEFVSFKKLSHQEIKSGTGTTLVGRQIQTGKDQAGTPLTFEGVQIFRIDPNFFVAVGMAFDANVPVSKRDDAVKDLTNLVDSVHVLSSAEAKSLDATQ